MAVAGDCGRLAEPSWHRRSRRVRSGQRLLAQVSSACVSLARHHGSAPPELLRPLLDALRPRAPLPRDVPWPSSLLSSSSGPPVVVFPSEDAVTGELLVTMVSSPCTSTSLSIGSHRSPKSVLMPLISIDRPEVAVTSVVASSSSTSGRNLFGGEWRPLPFKPSSTSIDIPVVAIASVVAPTSSSSPSLDRGTMAGDFRVLPDVQWQVLHSRFPPSFSQVASQMSIFRANVLKHQSTFRLFRSSSEPRGLSAAETLLYDKCSLLFEYALTECPSWPTLEFFIFRESFTTVLENFSAELANIVNLALGRSRVDASL
jgi:hypothetical protein